MPTSDRNRTCLVIFHVESKENFSLAQDEWTTTVAVSLSDGALAMSSQITAVFKGILTYLD